MKKLCIHQVLLIQTFAIVKFITVRFTHNTGDVRKHAKEIFTKFILADLAMIA